MSTHESIIAVLAIATILVLCGFANAATIPVGGSAGWSFGMGNWPPPGQTFKAGDVIAFNYNPSLHNVVVVDKASYDSCASNGTKFNSGHDQITLNAGTSYYICGFPGHCANGLKTAVAAV